jgi:pyrroloquinoline quinone biosynthesis protein E
MGGTPESAASLVPIREGEVEPYFAMHARVGQITGGIEIDAVRGSGVKAFPTECRGCGARDVCDGIDPKYLARHGTAEMRPYTHVEQQGTLLEERRRYLPPFFVKRAQYAKMKDVIRSFFDPEATDSVAEYWPVRVPADQQIDRPEHPTFRPETPRASSPV